ncbi:MAG: DUF3109 family protein [Rhodothermales bacterium]
MFVVEDKLISDELLDAPFACNLGACQGACCVQGDSGAPLEPEECAELEAILPRVRKHLSREALQVINKKGVWEEVEPGEYATTCIGKAECIFVTYDGSVAQCAIQKAHRAGRIDFPKPISCHLFPVRIERIGEYDVLNYEQVRLCNTARKRGRRHNIQLVALLREAFERKYGAAWYQSFRKVCEHRVHALNGLR